MQIEVNGLGSLKFLASELIFGEKDFLKRKKFGRYVTLKWVTFCYPAIIKTHLIAVFC